MSKLTTASGDLFHEEEWMGGDFFVKIGDEYVVKNTIAIMDNNKQGVFKKGEHIKVLKEDDGCFIIAVGKNKYKINKKSFYSLSSKLENTKKEV